jgi:hypothetical protein
MGGYLVSEIKKSPFMTAQVQLLVGRSYAVFILSLDELLDELLGR